MSGEPQKREQNAGSAINPTEQIAKFSIGVFGGLCAAFVPRMTTVISTDDPVIRQFAIFDRYYIIIAVALSLITGLAVVFTKWREPCRPAAIFWAALAMPAVIASSANMTNFEPYSKQLNAGSELAVLVQQFEGIKLFEPMQLQLMGSNDSANYKYSNENKYTLFKAALANQKESRFNKLIVIAQSNLFQVIIGPFHNEEEADQALDWLKKERISPEGVTVRSAQGNYFVLHSKENSLRPQATLTATTIKSRIRENNRDWEVGLKRAQ